MSADVALIIGRWQILQRGHVTLLRAALAAAPKVIVVIGSAWRSRDSRNPFTWQERQQQFEAVLSPEERARVSFLPVRDYFDDQRWNEAVHARVAKLVPRSAEIALVGFKKDHTSQYLDNFPGWRLHEVVPEYDISSTDLRAIYFEVEDRRTALNMMGDLRRAGRARLAGGLVALAGVSTVRVRAQGCAGLSEKIYSAVFPDGGRAGHRERSRAAHQAGR